MYGGWLARTDGKNAVKLTTACRDPRRATHRCRPAGEAVYDERQTGRNQTQNRQAQDHLQSKSGVAILPQFFKKGKKSYARVDFFGKIATIVQGERREQSWNIRSAK